MVIAIDGFSSCGKSSYAKKIAEKYHLKYIDSGAMYRAVTLFCVQNNLIKNDSINKELLIKRLNEINIQFLYNSENNQYNTFLNNKNIEEEIRKVEVLKHVSYISQIKEVRYKLLDLQRGYAKDSNIVMDGRDIGAVVFPFADIKIFMTADPIIRAKRRYDELILKNGNVSYNEILENVKERDYIDSTREINPLRKAKDAVELDNSHMTIDEQMKWFEENFNIKLNV